jgi:hypothetical protein
MTRTERIRKLANAIREYRGSYDELTKKWIRAPRPDARARCIHWLQKLGIEAVETNMAAIDGFKHNDEFQIYIKSL